MKVLFIYPYEQAVDNHNYEFHRIDQQQVQFNFAIAVLSAVLKQYGHEIKLLPLISEEHQSEVQEEKMDWADIFAFSISEAELEWTKKLSKSFKEKYSDKKQIIGGIGATLNPDILLNETEADAICVGEGEYAFPEYLKRLIENKDLRNIENLFIKENGKIYKSKIGQIVEDLDELPFYDYDLFDEFPQKHLESNMPRLYYLATRNCMFKCSFCANSRKKYAMGLKKSSQYVRRFSPERVVNDINLLQKKYPQAKVVHFNDEIIHSDPKWFEKFAYLYREQVNLPWRSYASLAILNEKVVQLMQYSNCYRVNVGIEAGSERIRKEIYERPLVTNAEMIKRMHLLKKHGIGIHASNLFGAPTETLDEMIETLMVNAEGGADILIGGVVIPYKNTKLYEICEEMNKLDVVEYNNNGVSIKPEENVTKEQIMFVRTYIVELVKILQYALTLSEESKNKIIDFIKWVIKNPEIDFNMLNGFFPLFFRDISNDLLYEKMETKLGRIKTKRK